MYDVTSFRMNHSINDNVTLTEDLEIQSDLTLGVEPGVTVELGAGIKLSISGTMFAEGTSSYPITFTSASATPQPGDWQGIYFNNADNNSTIENCTIEYAVYGIKTNNTDLTIEKSTIKNNSGNGINCYEASPTIYHNTIESNGIGILCQSNSSPYINNNYVIDNTSYGIYCTQTSNPYIRHNEISGNGPGGICCLNYSSPMLVGKSSSEPYGANKVVSNGGNGVLVMTNSNPNLGFHFGNQAGYNDIYNNSNKQVSNFTSTTIVAWKNWWGTSSPGPGLFYGSVDYSAYLTSPSPYAGPDWGESLAKTSVTMTQNSANDAEEYLLKGLSFEGAGDFEQAVAAYRYVVDRYGDTQYGPFALARLMACRVKQGDITVEKDYLSSVQQIHGISPTGITALLWQPLVEVRSGNEQEALALCDDIKDRFSDTDVTKDAKFLKGSIQLYELNDIDEAKRTFAEFAQEYSQDLLTEQINIILENYFPVDPALPKLQPENRNVLAYLPEDFYVSQNYPNPFNPTTTISYQLPAGKVQYFVILKIYDALGRLVKVLVEEQQTPGIHQIIWDGTDDTGRAVASGIYLYTIQAGDFRMTKKMVLMR